MKFSDNIKHMTSCSYLLARHKLSLLSFCSYVYILSLLCLTGCGDGSCYDNGSAVPMARFYASGTTTQLSANGLTVTAIGAPGDSLLVNNETVSDLHLPLRASTTSTQWRLTFTADDLTLTDTVTIDYQPVEYFASVECGAMYYFDITNVTTTHNVIDSITVPLPHVTHVDQLNLRIYVPND